MSLPSIPSWLTARFLRGSRAASTVAAVGTKNQFSMANGHGKDESAENFVHGVALLKSPHLNDGTAFSSELRSHLHLRGLVPPAIESLDQQQSRAIAFLRTLPNGLQKYCYLQRIKSENTTLFYRLLVDHLQELTPVVYTPTVGEACQKFSHIYTPSFAEGLFLTLDDADHLDEILGNWAEVYPDPDICVVTDGSRILGLGDLGMNGMGIPIGKLSLYVAAAGFHPDRTLPVTLDLGTNTESILADPYYLGTRRKRPDDKVFLEFVDKVMVAFRKRWPKMLVQFEDFSTEHAFELLERHRGKYMCFNDDIQGTGAVILSGFINAVRLSGKPLKDHRVLFFGAGSAAVGVATQIRDFFVRAYSKSSTSPPFSLLEEATSHFYLVDTKGLVYFNRTADNSRPLPPHKQLFARSDVSETNLSQNFNGAKDLVDIIRYVKPTALIGLASQRGAFKKEVIELMAQINERPIIFPLSNPDTNAECTFEEAMKWSENRVLFASGTAFPPYTYTTTTKQQSEPVQITAEPGQGNNMYIFPGLGLGSVLSGAERVTDEMIYAAAHALALSVDKKETEMGLLYPKLERIREISLGVATEVALTAVKENVATNKTLLDLIASTPSTLSTHTHSTTTAEPTLPGTVTENMDPSVIARVREWIGERMYEPKYLRDEE
ncbi:hypothetical protein HK102_005553, partial [Quaeritorhiza haematococci]